MATVLRVRGFAFAFYPKDHHPPHVHVHKAGAVVVLLLDPIRIREVHGMRDREVAMARAIAIDHAEFLMAKWREWRDK